MKFDFFEISYKIDINSIVNIQSFDYKDIIIYLEDFKEIDGTRFDEKIDYDSLNEIIKVNVETKFL